MQTRYFMPRLPLAPLSVILHRGYLPNNNHNKKQETMIRRRRRDRTAYVKSWGWNFQSVLLDGSDRRVGVIKIRRHALFLGTTKKKPRNFPTTLWPRELDEGERQRCFPTVCRDSRSSWRFVREAPRRKQSRKQFRTRLRILNNNKDKKQNKIRTLESKGRIVRNLKFSIDGTPIASNLRQGAVRIVELHLHHNPNKYVAPPEKTWRQNVWSLDYTRKAKKEKFVSYFWVHMR